MLKISKEFKTGLTYIIVLFLFVWGYFFLKKENLFGNQPRIFRAEYTNIQGLSNASMVTLNGMEVGKITQINFSNDKTKQGIIEVSFSIKPNINFSKNSIVKLYSTGLMGGKALAIIPSYQGEPATHGTLLNGDIESGFLAAFSEKLNPIQANLENVIIRADKLMEGLNDVLNESSQNHLSKVIKNLDATVQNFKYASNGLNSIVQNNEKSITQTLNNAQKATNNLAKISENLNKAELDKAVTSISSSFKSLNTILTGIENGSGTLGKLSQNDSLYNNLTNASKELEELLRDFKLHPKRYIHISVFGKKNKKYEKPQ